MARSIFGVGLVAIAITPFIAGGCAAQARVGTETPASASEESSSSSTSESKPEPASTPAPSPNASAAPSEPVKPPTGCTLVCAVAHRGRVAPEDEARLTSSLADISQRLRECVGGGRTPSMTLRFDSTGTITGFGVDEERGQAVCIDAINHQTPAVSYPGPATLRCSERCGGDVTSPTRRRSGGSRPRRGR